MIFTIAAIFTSGFASIVCIALLGLAHSIMWPAIWPLSLDGLGKFTKIGSALLIMGIAGGAIIPPIYGALADSMNPQQAYWIMIPCRSEEHTSDLQSLMRTSYAVFCLKTKKKN